MEALYLGIVVYREAADYAPVTTVVIAVVAILIWGYKQHFKGLPPGPFNLPLIGQMFGKRNEKRHEYFHRLSDTYGPITGVYVGIQYVVVVSDYDWIKEMSTMDQFNSRPDQCLSISKEYKIFNELSGVEWKHHRRFMLKSLKTLGMGSARGDILIRNQAKTLCGQIKEGSKSVPLGELLSDAIRNTAMRLVAGETFQKDVSSVTFIKKFSKTWSDLVEEATLNFYYPWRKWCSFWKNKQSEWHKHFDKLLRNEIKKHQNSPGEPAKDYMDFCIQEMAENASFTESSLLGNSIALLLTGSESLSQAIQWCLQILAQNQDIQAKIHLEITDQIGKGLNWKDRNHCRFTQAFILEVFRSKDIVPINDPRWTVDDVFFHDFLIPKNSVVLFRFQGVHQDQDIWGDPEVFRPERFLTSDSKSINAEMSKYVLPFSLGKRKCPAEKLAMAEIFLYISSIVRQFKLTFPESNEKSDHLEREAICFEIRN